MVKTLHSTAGDVVSSPGRELRSHTLCEAQPKQKINEHTEDCETAQVEKEASTEHERQAGGFKKRARKKEKEKKSHMFGVALCAGQGLSPASLCLPPSPVRWVLVICICAEGKDLKD